MERCRLEPKTVRNVDRAIEKIENFCRLLSANKVKETKEAFLGFPESIQCMFLAQGHDILAKKVDVDDLAYRNAFYLFKLFRSKDMKELNSYAKGPGKLAATEILYKKAYEWYKINSAKVAPSRVTTSSKSKSPSSRVTTSSKSKSPSSRSKSTPARTRKNYDKKYQKHDEPSNEVDPLYIYYTSLYDENPKSKLAIVWLAEHGIFEGTDREMLEKKYEKVKVRK